MKNLLITFMLSFCAFMLPLGYVSANEAQEPLPAITEGIETTISVDVNSAGPEELATLLTGVGMKKAQAIVLYREENGAFKTSDDLLNVKGIGPSILKKNENRIKY